MANKITRHIPNTITCCNLISGCIAIIAAIYGDLWLALLFIVIGSVFDFFDGMSARLLHVSAPIGKELDSLADVITFGLAPSAMLFHQLTVLEYPFGSVCRCQIAVFLPFAAFLMTAFSALRLAKFNLDERQTTSFIGLPTPANALFWGSLLLGLDSQMQAVNCLCLRSDLKTGDGKATRWDTSSYLAAYLCSSFLKDWPLPLSLRGMYYFRSMSTPLKNNSNGVFL